MSVQPEARGKQQVLARRDAFVAGRDPTVAIAAADPGEPVTPGLLPRDVPGFTGRAEELARLMALAAGGRVVVTVIGGIAGVGKTALALHAAHQLLGEFPDGHLYADLHGCTEGQDPAQPGEVLEVFLRSLGVAAEDVPADAEERSGLLRQVLASRRVLMVLDNARAETQVRPLLPGAGTSLVLVTSRSVLPGLEADERIVLDVLIEDDAVAMLAGLGGHRAAADPTAVAQVSRLCGRLPLALRIAGQLLATHPTWPVVRLVQLLASERERLTRLGSGDPQVRAAFEVSYRQLAEADARLFRLLGLHPGPDFTTTAAAALAGTDDDAAEPALRRLAAAHLIAEDTVGRFALHDLLRRFARDTCQQADTLEDRNAAETRLVRHYENLAAFLDSCVDPKLRSAAEQDGKPLSSMRQALAVFQAERPSLLAALCLATQRGWDEEIRRLSASMAGPLTLLRYLDDLLTVRESALAAARHAGETRAEGRALSNLGETCRRQRRFEEAITSYQQALVIFRKFDDRRAEGLALNDLGIVYQELRGFDEAIISYQQALVIFREVGDRHGEGLALDNLGIAHRELGRFDEAIISYQQALVIFRDAGDRRGQGQTLSDLGSAYRELRRFDEAITSYQQALAIRREVSDWYGEGQTLNHLGSAYGELQRSQEAIISFQQALVIFRKVGDRHEEGETLNNLGVAYEQVRRFDEAIASYQQTLAIKREARDRHGEGQTLNNLGNAYGELRRFEEASISYQQALAIFREVGDRHGEGGILTNLGTAYQEKRQPDRAAGCWREAASALRAAGDHEQAARLEQLAANVQARRRWWQRAAKLAEIWVSAAALPQELQGGVEQPVKLLVAGALPHVVGAFHRVQAYLRPGCQQRVPQSHALREGDPEVGGSVGEEEWRGGRGDVADRARVGRQLGKIEDQAAQQGSLPGAGRVVRFAADRVGVRLDAQQIGDGVPSDHAPDGRPRFPAQGRQRGEVPSGRVAPQQDTVRVNAVLGTAAGHPVQRAVDIVELSREPGLAR
jgi:tetratricopeptide (TPR) repeat protein